MIRLAFLFATELKKHKISAVAVWPGFIRSEAMLEYFKVTEANWQDAIKQRPDFSISETPFYTGRVVAAMAADRKIAKKSERVFGMWDLGPEYGVTDVDGRQPSVREWIKENLPQWGEWKSCDDGFYAYWGVM